MAVIADDIFFSQSGWRLYKAASSFSSGASQTYIHIKTNITASNIMYNITAEGYNYGTGAPIKCDWVGYYYFNGAHYNVNQHTYYTGMTANGQYISSDNYIVLRGSFTSSYYIGFVLDALFCNPTGNSFDFSVQGYALNNTSGAHY